MRPALQRRLLQRRVLLNPSEAAASKRAIALRCAALLASVILVACASGAKPAPPNEHRPPTTPSTEQRTAPSTDAPSALAETRPQTASPEPSAPETPGAETPPTRSDEPASSDAPQPTDPPVPAPTVEPAPSSPRRVGAAPHSLILDLIQKAEREKLHSKDFQLPFHRGGPDHDPAFYDAIVDSCRSKVKHRITCDHERCGARCRVEQIHVELQFRGAWRVTRFDVDWHDRHHGCGICL